MGKGNRTTSHLSALYASNDHNQLEEDDRYSPVTIVAPPVVQFRVRCREAVDGDLGETD